MSKELVKLPSLDEIYGDIEATEKQNQLNLLLNQPPKNEWLKDHPYAKVKKNGQDVPLPFIPIARLEWLMTRIFTKWWVDIKNAQIIANSICVVVTVHYEDPLTGVILHQDGIGACPLQTDKDAGATDFNRIKSNAVQIGAPAAESYAFKDAVEKIGKLFGKDISRPDEIAYQFTSLIPQDEPQLTSEQTDLLSKAASIPDEKITAELREKLIARIKSDEFEQHREKVINYINSLLA